MTEVNGQEAPAEVEAAERGRYAVYNQPDGGLLIARAVNLCDRCLDCGCGEQAEPIGPISGALVAMARAAASGKAKIPAAMQRLMNRAGPAKGAADGWNDGR